MEFSETTATNPHQTRKAIHPIVARLHPYRRHNRGNANGEVSPWPLCNGGISMRSSHLVEGACRWYLHCAAVTRHFLV